MQVTFLGTNGWYDSLTGNTVSALITARDYDIILDAGNGIAKADRYISQDKPVFLFISHFHLDHTEGLHTLVKFRFRKGLAICGQIGTRADLAGLVREPYTVPLDKVPFAVTVTELEDGTHELPFRVTCLPLVHPVPCPGLQVRNRREGHHLLVLTRVSATTRSRSHGAPTSSSPSAD